MKLFEVYPLFDIEPVKAEGCYIYDAENTQYLDLYGGHAVISIGHTHPRYTQAISDQLSKIAFYSNSVQNKLQSTLAQKLGEVSGLGDDYQLFMCNSGAEANENALKLASFHNGRKKIIALDKAFHGRTAAAVVATHNPKIIAPVNEGIEAIHVPFGDLEAILTEIRKEEACAVLIEAIQGVGGIRVVDKEYFEAVAKCCEETNTLLIADEVQSGYARSGKFFAYQYANIQPDLITMAKGMGNGFPIGGVLVNKKYDPWFGMLGTTFGGNHLACAAGIAVLDVIKEENLLQNATSLGKELIEELKTIPQIKEVRGRGLMIGLEFDFPIADLRKKLLFEEKIFTGVTGANIIRLLPPLNVTKEQLDTFVSALKKVLA